MNYFSWDDGLFSVQVKDVIQDSTGFIWVATIDGLFRYDGVEFNTYRYNIKDSTSIPSNEINKLFSDSRGRLWIGTISGLCFLNKDKQNFSRIKNLTSSSPGISENINRICEDRDGNILFSSWNTLFLFDRGKDSVQVLLDLSEEGISSIITRKGFVWIATQNNPKLIKYELASGRQSEQEIKDANNGHFLISDMAFYKGKLWLTTLGSGVKYLDLSTNQVTSLPSNSSDESNAVKLYIDRSNRLWSLDYTGLKCLNEDEKSFLGFYPRPNDPFSLKSAANGIYQDRQGNYWVYHYPGGLGICYRPKGFRSYSDYPYDYWHISGENVSSLGGDRDGNLWIGSAQSGLTAFEWNSGIRNYEHNETDPNSIGRGSVLEIYGDSRNVMWVSTYFSGLQYFDSIKRCFHSYYPDNNIPGSIGGTDIRSITEDEDGNLWMAIHGKGIDKFDRKHAVFTHYTNAQNNLSNDWTYFVLTDSKGNLWAASAWGLSFLQKGDSVFNFYFNNPEDSSTISSSTVTCLYEDKSGQIWAGTANGLNLFNPATNNFTRYELDEKTCFICSIQSTNDTTLWLGTRNGLLSFNRFTGEKRYFEKEDGLTSDEYFVNGGYTAPDGTIYIGGNKGVDYFQPSKLWLNNVPPPVIIDRIRAFGKKSSLLLPDTIFYNLSADNKRIILKHSTNNISIDFRALNYINPKHNLYRYKLDKLDKNWIDAGNRSEAFYPHLDPGHYTFWVIAANNDGTWNEQGATVELIVKAPWYESPFIRLLIIIIILGLAYLYSMIRTRRLLKQQQVLEKTIAEKTFELKEKNKILDQANQMLIEKKDLLEQQSEELRRQSESLAEANQELQKLNTTKDKLFSVIAHDLTNPFNTIIGFSNLLVSDNQRLSEEEKITFLNIINSSSNKVFNLLQQLLVWARAQTKRIQYNPVRMDLREIIDLNIKLAAEALEEKEIQLEISSPANSIVYADHNLCSAIVRNLLNNAVKFTPTGGKITITIHKKGSIYKTSFTDTGVGMSKELIRDLLSNELVTPERGTDGETGTGLGLSLCREFVQMNQGEFSITSKEGVGSTFTFTLPVYNNQDGS